MATEIVELSSSAKFTWKIENFFKLDAQEGTYSDVFSVGSFKWKVHIYPKGKGKIHDHVSMYLCPVDSTKFPYAEFSFTITSQTDSKNIVKKQCKHKFDEDDSGWGWGSFMRLSDLHDPAKGYIVDDTFVIRIDVSCRMDEKPVDDDDA
ncbi:hypothetical protein MKX03_029390 [Papaver bracteatum]|nr:hypothetical protein MKX03_029390 [Papaver bracteatum]